MLLLIWTYVLLQAKFKAPIVTEIAEVCLLCSTCCAARSHMLFDGRNVLHTDLCHSDHVHSFPPSLPPLQISKYTPAEDYHQQYLAKGGRNGSAQSPAKVRHDEGGPGGRNRKAQSPAIVRHDEEGGRVGTMNVPLCQYIER